MNVAIPSLSIIIPALNEAANLPSLLAELQVPSIEVIVVDGGSQDDTVAVARSLGVSVISAPVGRANQMNAGAAIATSNTLLFLHADTRLPAGFDPWVHQTLAQPGVVAGAFELQIDGQEWGLRVVEWGVRWRSRLLQLPYGDQALFLKKSTFEAIGGFPDLPIMEDFVLVQTVKQLGRVAIVPLPVVTSARRWQRLGVFKTTLLNQLIILAYRLGIPPKKLLHLYRNRVQR